MKAWSIVSLLFTAAILSTVPVSPQVTPHSVELSVDQAQAQATYGRYRRATRRAYRRAGYAGAPGYGATAAGYDYGGAVYGYGCGLSRRTCGLSQVVQRVPERFPLVLDRLRLTIFWIESAASPATTGSLKSAAPSPERPASVSAATRGFSKAPLLRGLRQV
jgi:hypothetical protein